MEPVTLTLAAVLATKALEGAGKSVGEDAAHGVQRAVTRLVALVRRKFHGDKSATEILDKVELDDSASLERLSQVLRRYANEDPQFQRDLDSWLGEASQDASMQGFITQVSGDAHVDKIVNIHTVQGDVHL